MHVPCLYINTSILIKAVNPRDPNREASIEIIEECCTRYTCVYSSVHGLEPWRAETWRRAATILRSVRATACRTDAVTVLREANRLRREWSVTRSRVIDIAHIVAASMCGCKGIIAVDRFIRSKSTLLGLNYINYYTGCPR